MGSFENFVRIIRGLGRLYQRGGELFRDIAGVFHGTKWYKMRQGPVWVGSQKVAGIDREWGNVPVERV